MFKIVGALSVLAIGIGLFFRSSLGVEVASILVIGGAVAGSINVLLEFASWFRK